MTRPHRISSVRLDAGSLGVRTETQIEVERHRTISDLLEENSFRLAAQEAAEGPYEVCMSLQEERFVMQVACTVSGHAEDISMPLAPLKRHIRDYTIVCDNFYKTAQAGEVHRLEAIDAGRRSIHNEAAEVLAETLENKVILDKATARRLFSLLYVLHIRSHPTLT